jgi:hypothetical protein
VTKESSDERLDREHGELLEELRALIPGAEVLFGFLLAIRFTSQFQEVSPLQRYVYYATLVLTSIALVLLMAPAVFHRLRFRAHDKEYALQKGNREAIFGTVAIALSLTGVIYLVTDLVLGERIAPVVASVFFAFTAWRWWAVALVRILRGSPKERSRR